MVKKIIAGKFVGPGVNRWCLGIAPDTIASSAGKQFENYKGLDNLGKEMDVIVKSKEGRRFARSYDRTIGKVLNPIHNTVNKSLEIGTNKINMATDKIKNIFKMPRVTIPIAQPKPIPIAI